MSATLEPSTDWQIETIRAFVVKQKRDRYVDKISSPRKRAEFVESLSHFADFDPRFIVRIAPASQHPAAIETILRSKGAPETCKVISESNTLDRKAIPLLEALSEINGRWIGTILCCIPGQLAYFENEDDRFILERKI